MRLCLERLTASAADVSARIDAGPETQEAWWAHALARQCQDALYELRFLAPWTELPSSQNRLGESFSFDDIPTLRGLAGLEKELLQAIENRHDPDTTPAARARFAQFRQFIAVGSRRASSRIAAIEHLAQQAGELAQIEYEFLYDRARHLLSIGYNVGERRPDSGYYDLLASEARLCCFVGVAQGRLPQESWFALGRLLTGAGGEPILLSWSGTMFEYLMPLLVMPTYENTLLDQTCKEGPACMG